jgi:hypothetical protein
LCWELGLVIAEAIWDGILLRAFLCWSGHWNCDRVLVWAFPCWLITSVGGTDWGWRRFWRLLVIKAII